MWLLVPQTSLGEAKPARAREVLCEELSCMPSPYRWGN